MLRRLILTGFVISILSIAAYSYSLKDAIYLSMNNFYKKCQTASSSSTNYDFLKKVPLLRYV